MFYVWTQSPIMEEEYWINLKKELSVSINEWEQVIDEWNVCSYMFIYIFNFINSEISKIIIYII